MKKISLCNLHIPLDVVELTFTGSRSTQTSGSAVQHPNHYITEAFKVECASTTSAASGNKH